MSAARLSAVGSALSPREAWRRYQKGQAQNSWHDGPHQPRGRSRRRPPACASHSTQVSYGSTRRVAPATDSPDGSQREHQHHLHRTSHEGACKRSTGNLHSLRAFNVTERVTYAVCRSKSSRLAASNPNERIPAAIRRYWCQRPWLPAGVIPTLLSACYAAATTGSADGRSEDGNQQENRQAGPGKLGRCPAHARKCCAETPRGCPSWRCPHRPLA